MTLRSHLQHRLNPLHVYCRLRTLGFADKAARAVTSCYERMLYRLVLA
ncbi:hypothetical protein [Pseudodesulfovibrio sp. zrk46]|nr:hypothetical protein [Pseudodesulfovibrio sp. zrk46]QJB56991.1 hypothetical protein HFN16_11525 [Pseudodesulfovibrio sp. zrk46]